jgi:two-component system, sensor histidine kinase PdtaS
MYRLSELARVHCELAGPEIEHLEVLVVSWGLLADLSFSDLLLYTPCAPPDGAAAPGRGSKGTYVTLAQVRPATTQTVYQRDHVGEVVQGAERPVVDRTFRAGEATTLDAGGSTGEALTLLGVPVRFGGRVIAVLTSEGLPSGGRRHGELEKAYLAAFHQLARMIARGDYPFPRRTGASEEVPRVGDGAVLLDADGRLRYSSPNANSALHRLGVLAQTEGRTLGQLGLDDAVVRTAVAQREPATAELSRGNHTHVLVHVVPLLERSMVTGLLVLLRDISDLKRLGRLLVSKDTHIREIHHRVKNNLQTISSLLRIQARRLASVEARRAIDESVRRIASIAVVHETLSRDAADDVPFLDIVRPIVRMVEESLVSPERPIHFVLVGSCPTLPVDVATPLALALTELLQNAVDHAYPTPRPQAGRVEISVATTAARRVLAVVRDDGDGLPDGFDPEKGTGLGLSIVRTLVEQELLGRLAITDRTDGSSGTQVTIDVPLTVAERA